LTPEVAVKRCTVTATLLSLAVWLHAAAPLTAAELAGTEAADELEEEFDAEMATPARARKADPLWVYNRFMFRVNDRLYLWVVEPVARGYAWGVPVGVRASVARFFRNLEFPINLVNAALQGRFRKAGVECGRFLVNTTAGILGLFDVAEQSCGWAPTEEDFGQTLARYGVGDGWPLTLPVLGPCNLRDTVGLVPDYFLDPVSYLHRLTVRLSVRAGERLNTASLHLGEYEEMTRAALDPYVLLKDAYRQNRAKKIKE
jgi:phospholipid-binding lipoprotein MlaA